MVALTAVCRDGWEVLRGYEGGGADELTGIDVNNPNVVDVVNKLVLFLSLDQGKSIGEEKICGDLGVPRNFVGAVKVFSVVMKRLVREIKTEHPSIKVLVYETARSVLIIKRYLVVGKSSEITSQIFAEIGSTEIY